MNTTKNTDQHFNKTKNGTLCDDGLNFLCRIGFFFCLSFLSNKSMNKGDGVANQTFCVKSDSTEFGIQDNSKSFCGGTNVNKTAARHS